MSFEEQFPSVYRVMGELPSLDGDNEEVVKEYKRICKVFEENCLDKQKVREAIDKIISEKHDYYGIKEFLKEANKELKKELGLDK